ncbi:MAG: hypothetical protein WBL27_08395 [Salinimicrobium sp.]
MLLLFLCLPMLLFAQDEPKKEVTEVHQELAVGQDWSSKQIGVKFLKVISDSRCPRQVTCIWAGEAKVLLGISVNGEYFEKEVTLSGTRVDLQLPDKSGVIISNLYPYPETAEGIDYEDYCIRFTTTLPE